MGPVQKYPLKAIDAQKNVKTFNVTMLKERAFKNS